MSETLDKQKVIDKLDKIISTLETDNNSHLTSKKIDKYYLNLGSIVACKSMIKVINEGMFDKEE